MAKKNTFFGALVNGLLIENPTFVLMVGMCPTLAVTTAASNAIGMGLSTTVVLVCSNLFISLLRNLISEKIRIPAFIVVIASFVTIVEMVMKAYLPELSATLGLYIPLIVVNCIIFARAEAFAFKNGPILALGDGLGMGLGFTAAITILASVREIFGAGTFFGQNIMGSGYQPMAILTSPAGGFLTLGVLLVIVNMIRKKIDARMLERKEANAA
ncbi:MAG: electron transport complex subunit RsxE [Clostridiales bacterium]|nr:electron transport complex subunit RsxE [Clostridiales bacterium]